MTHTNCWAAWRRELEARAHRPLPIIRDDLALPPHTRRLLARSLGVFRLGEAGEGRIAREARRISRWSIDDDYRRALELFVREEGRHARILGDMLAALGEPPLERAPAELLFRLGRRLLGLRLELMVLLAAEIVSVVFYEQLISALPPGTFRQALSDVARDEERHRRFHAAFLRRAFPGVGARTAMTLTWSAIAALSCAVVAWDHRHTLRALHVDERVLVQRTAEAIIRTAHDLVPLKAAYIALEITS